jgi:hypothetical protein
MQLMTEKWMQCEMQLMTGKKWMQCEMQLMTEKMDAV